VTCYDGLDDWKFGNFDTASGANPSKCPSTSGRDDFGLLLDQRAQPFYRTGGHLRTVGETTSSIRREPHGAVSLRRASADERLQLLRRDCQQPSQS
jgi:hypothetical protein